MQSAPGGTGRTAEARTRATRGQTRHARTRTVSSRLAPATERLALTPSRRALTPSGLALTASGLTLDRWSIPLTGSGLAIGSPGLVLTRPGSHSSAGGVHLRSRDSHLLGWTTCSPRRDSYSDVDGPCSSVWDSRSRPRPSRWSSKSSAFSPNIHASVSQVRSGTLYASPSGGRANSRGRTDLLSSPSPDR